MPDLRTVYIVSPAHPLRGGIASSSERLAQELQSDGFSVKLISYTLQYPSFLFPGKTQFTDDPAPGGLTIAALINTVNPFNWWKVGRRLAREAPDLVIFRYWLPFMGPCLGAIARLIRFNGRTRCVALADNIIPHEKRPGDRLFTQYFCSAMDGFIAMSKSVQEDIGQFAHKQQPTELIPHPIYDNYGDSVSRQTALQHLGLSQDVAYLLFFGFIRDYKGLDLLLRAMVEPALKKLNLQLIVAGEYYGNEETYKALIAGLGIADRLVMRTDYISNEEVRYYFSAADLVVQPYKTATQSGISQLAYHFEKPMVITNVGGLPEIVPHGEAGYVVDPTPAAIADAVADFFENNRSAALSRGVALGKKRFSWANMVDGITRIYQRISVKS